MATYALAPWVSWSSTTNILNMPLAESQPRVLFVYHKCYVQLIEWNSFHIENALYLMENPQNWTWQKKNYQNRTKTDRFTAFLELIFAKKNDIMEPSSDFTIIRKMVFSSKAVVQNDILHILA